MTGIWFHSHQSATVTLAPSIMPVGMMNMFTTECSKPCAKKMKTGIQAAAILPIVEVGGHRQHDGEADHPVAQDRLDEDGDHAGGAE